MIPINREAAIKHSIEIAKILCEAQGSRISPDANGANALADFIETLQNRFIESSEKSD